MRKLWNRPNMPVWSLSTADGETPNLNICTYVTSVSMDPKLMLIAVYTGTKTLSNLKNNKHCLLQLLPEELAPVVRVCGQTSGHTTHKVKRLAKRYEFLQVDDLVYFAQAVGYMELQIESLREVGGDHVLAVARVVSAKNLSDAPILTTDYLKEHKYTR